MASNTDPRLRPDAVFRRRATRYVEINVLFVTLRALHVATLQRILPVP